MNETVQPGLQQENAALRAEIARMQKVVDALIAQAERVAEGEQTDFGVFQTTIMLEEQVRSRTRQLGEALQHIESMNCELQQAKAKAEQSEAHLRAILDSAPIGMCMVDHHGRYVFANKAFCDMLGYDWETLSRLNPLMLTHPDDMQTSTENLQKLMGGEIQSYQVEKRYLHRDGHAVWTQLTTAAVDTQNGERGYIGQVVDISARRAAEEQLRLAATVYQASSEAMMISDAENRIVATNPAFTELTGYTLEEVQGKNPKLFSSGMQDKDFYRAMWQEIKESGHWEGEIWNRKKSGAFYAEWLTINAVRDSKGVIRNFVALFSDITEKKKADAVVWGQANYDTLTQVPNRRLFHDRLDQGVKKSHRTAGSLALLFMDLDRFKEVNDTLGHQAGDELLVQVARRITANVRATDTVARLGGDEFTVILFDVADHAHIDRVARALVDELAHPFSIGPHLVSVSASVGIAVYPNDAAGTDDLIRLADQAMYASKRGGGNRYTYSGALGAE
ncbi:MAG: diguanylate cyclase [Pseudomonadota bacterium]